MNSDVATLQNIADTLKEEPLASQRLLAENAGMSIGLMYAVIKRFVERGWLMLTNVNLRKLSYAITPKGISELSARSHTFARRTFALANKYNDTIIRKVSDAKSQGKNRLVLYGESYIKFLLVYACQTLGVDFAEKKADEEIEAGALCIAGEECSESELSRLTENGCINLLNLIEETANE